LCSNILYLCNAEAFFLHVGDDRLCGFLICFAKVNFPVDAIPFAVVVRSPTVELEVDVSIFDTPPTILVLSNACVRNKTLAVMCSPQSAVLDNVKSFAGRDLGDVLFRVTIQPGSFDLRRKST